MIMKKFSKIQIIVIFMMLVIIIFNNINNHHLYVALTSDECSNYNENCTNGDETACDSYLLYCNSDSFEDEEDIALDEDTSYIYDTDTDDDNVSENSSNNNSSDVIDSNDTSNISSNKDKSNDIDNPQTGDFGLFTISLLLIISLVVIIFNYNLYNKKDSN